MAADSSLKTFYTDHWAHIEDERVQRYEAMFVWHEGQRTLLEPAELKPGHRVLDIGSGPGFFAGGLADIVGTSGSVAGVDINARFVADANERHRESANIEFAHVQDHHLPFADASFDRVICKNVLEYVPDVGASLAEVARVLKPGGLVLVIDSDWGFVIVQPWAKTTVDRFFAAASQAFKEPYIGRRGAGYLSAAGLQDVTVKLSPYVDQSGRGLHVLRNMASYIGQFETMPMQEVEGLLAEVEAELEAGRFLFCLPQFLISARKAS